MAQFTVNAQRLDPYKNFKFRVTSETLGAQPGAWCAVVHDMPLCAGHE